MTQRGAPSLICMGTWLPEDMTAKGLPLPSEVENKLSDDTSRELTEKMWAALDEFFAEYRNPAAAKPKEEKVTASQLYKEVVGAAA